MNICSMSISEKKKLNISIHGETIKERERKENKQRSQACIKKKRKKERKL